MPGDREGVGLDGKGHTNEISSLSQATRSLEASVGTVAGIGPVRCRPRERNGSRGDRGAARLSVRGGAGNPGNPVQTLESLQDTLPQNGTLQRVVIFGPETGARYLSAVLVRVPPRHEFPLHTHPSSEDCFFVLSGGGEVTEPGRAVPLSAPAAVWIPAGHPHGLAAGPAGVLEVGFQGPPDPTVVPFDPGEDAPRAPALLTHTLSPNPTPGAGAAGWVALFPSRPAPRCLAPYYATLRTPGCLVADATEGELVVVVASGAVDLTGAGHRRLHALGALRLGPGTTVELRAVDVPALLLAVRAQPVA